MKTASTLLLIASALAALAAIWAPGAWWQWLATAVILLLAGAGTGAAADTGTADEPEHTPEPTGDRSGRPTYGLPSAPADDGEEEEGR